MRQNKIPSEHIALVERIARSVARSLGAWLGSQEYGDLVQAGLMCYGGVVERHDPEKGSFENYLGLRSRGAMLDYLRSLDLVGQRERRKIRSMERVRLVLTNELQREPTVVELAERMGLSVREVQELCNAPLLCNLEHPAIFDTLSVQPPDLGEESISVTIDRVVQGTFLTERQGKVLQMVREGKTQKEIAGVFGITEAAISQTMTKVIHVLQRTVRRQKLLNGGQEEMGSHRHTRPTAAASGFALKAVVKHLWGRDSFNLGDIQALSLEKTLGRFHAASWAQSAKGQDQLRTVGTNDRLFRFNRNSRPVIEAAMEAGHLAGKAVAEKRALELITQDGAEFVAFCEALAEAHPDGQFFTAGDVHEAVCTLLDLDQKVWAKASISHLLVTISRQMPMRIRHESKGVGGYHFKITLPSPGVPKEKAPEEIATNIVAPPEPPLVKAEEAPVVQQQKGVVEVLSADAPVSPFRPSAAPRKYLNGYREIAFLEAMVAHWDDRVIPTKDVGEAMGRVSKEWANRTTYSNFLVAFRKAGILLSCTNSGELDSNTRGYSRLNLEHAQVGMIRERVVPQKRLVAATPVVATVAPEVEEEDVNTSLESLTQASPPEPEPEVTEDVEPNEPGAPALTSEDEGRDREELPAPPEEITLSFTPPTHTRAELEEQIRQVQAHQLQDSDERREIAEKIRVLKERDLELSQRAPLREQEIVHLEQELTKLEHAKKEVAKKLGVILKSLSPFEIEMLKAELLEQG